MDVFRRNFRFTSIEDPAAFRLLDLIGAENVMVECDYPHNDSTWPSIQSLLKRDLGHLQPPDIDLICIGNAVDLYGAQPPTAEWTARTERICEESGGPAIA